MKRVTRTLDTYRVKTPDGVAHYYASTTPVKEIKADYGDTPIELTSVKVSIAINHLLSVGTVEEVEGGAE